MIGEFELIKRYFDTAMQHTDLGVGDDAALITMTPGMQCVVSTDILVEGTHFLPNTDAEALGHKSLAVNLSDMAAMGANPRWAFLSLSLPDADESWIAPFAKGFMQLARAYDVDLAGGDTTRGPRAINVAVMGEVPRGKALLRSGAKVGDDVWVSGATGEAALGLMVARDKLQVSEVDAARCVSRLNRPSPRVALGVALRDIASAAIDISDGFLADLGHICERSYVGALIDEPTVPWSSALSNVDVQTQRRLVFAGGDDYELCFTAPQSQRDNVMSIANRVDVPLARCGRIVSGAQVELRDKHLQRVELAELGFDHFR